MLGTCEENKAVEIEEALFSDDAFFAQVQRVKTSLLEREAAAKLAPELSAALALQLKRSPRLQEELQQVREAQAHQALRSAVEKTPTPWFVPAAWLPGSASLRWTLGLAAVAALLAIIAGSVLRAPRPASSPAPVLQAVQPALAPAPASLATVLFLPAGVLRGPSNAPALPLPDSTRPVELQVQVHGSAAETGQWTATLTHAGHSSLSAQPASLRKEGTIHYLSLTVPPGLLTPGVYNLTLTPANALASPPPPVDRTFIIAQK